MDKLVVYVELEANILNRLANIQSMLADALSATTDDSKSTAGDKHETGRAMAHLEQEKLGSQYAEATKLLDHLRRLDPNQKSEEIQLGSLVETSIGFLYLSLGIGQLDVNGTKVFCLTPMAPLGKALLGKKANEQIDWQGKKIDITSVA
jgi:transcription elongation GreA/GreB family factor